MSDHYIRLPLKNSYNTRDLGGYPTVDGGVTRWRAFLRSDDLNRLDKSDIQFLLDYGLTAVADLRSPEEALRNVDPFAKHDGISYTNIPFMSEGVDDVTKLAIDNPAEFIPAFYMSLIKNSHTAIVNTFEFFAGQPEGCILFHCAAGKDRTGIIAMLLLGLAGVSRFDIIANYETTFAFSRNNAALGSIIKVYGPEVMFSKADYMEPVIDYIFDAHGGFGNYLADIGVREDVLAKVLKRLV